MGKESQYSEFASLSEWYGLIHNYRLVGLDPETGGTIAAGPGSSRYGSKPAYRTLTIGANITF